MASSTPNPRRVPMTTRDPNRPSDALSLKTSTLRKGATFQAPSSPSGLSPLRRTQTTLDDVVDAYRRRANLIVDTFDQTLASGNHHSSPSSTIPHDNSLPVPSGFVGVTLEEMITRASIHPDEERRVLRPRAGANKTTAAHPAPSDSGIGSSIVTSNQKRALAVGSCASKAITRSAAGPAATSEAMSQKASNRIREHILRPLIVKPSLKDFRPIVQAIPRKIQRKEIVCLRDLEKTLLYTAPTKARTAGLYLEFCLTSLALIQGTVDQLSEREQIRTQDRPYTNGYLVDLCDQVKQYAARLSVKDKSSEATSLSDYQLSDEVRLYGGIAVNGKEAELIRVTKSGNAYSLRDGRLIEDFNKTAGDGADEDMDGMFVPRFKRSLSQTLENEDEIKRSMARRKKNPTPEELAPKVCDFPGCQKEFARPCDLTKHRKTHSRPFKCPKKTCKYSKIGWPTDKECERHVNDKHLDNPVFHMCKFAPCPYKSKRESNCKQHMEKTHGWKYDRTKNNGKKNPASPPSTTSNPTPLLPSLPTPISEQTPGFPTPISEQAFGQSPSPFPAGVDPTLLPILQPQEDFTMQFGERELDLDMDLDLSPGAVTDNGTPSTDISNESLFNFQPLQDDIYSANMQLPNSRAPDMLAFMEQVAYPLGQMPLPTQPINVPQNQPHISPIGQGNTMLFTPSSMVDVDEGFGDDFSPATGDKDFLLFDMDAAPKPVDPVGFGMSAASKTMFGEIPSNTPTTTAPPPPFMPSGLVSTAPFMNPAATASSDFMGLMDPLSATNFDSLPEVTQAQLDQELLASYVPQNFSWPPTQ